MARQLALTLANTEVEVYAKTWWAELPNNLILPSGELGKFTLRFLDELSQSPEVLHNFLQEARKMSGNFYLFFFVQNDKQATVLDDPNLSLAQVKHVEFSSKAAPLCFHDDVPSVNYLLTKFTL